MKAEIKRRAVWTVLDIVLMALLAAILMLQKELMSFLPNISLTVFLILLYAKCLGFGRTAVIVTVYLLLDSVLWASLNPIFTTAQWIGWMLGPLLYCTAFKKTENNIVLACAAALAALLYCWVMIVPTALIYTNQMESLGAYILVDIPWELVLAISGFVPTLLLYEPLSKLMRKLLARMRQL